MEFEAVIGLEVHAQLLTASKIFCGCKAVFGLDPNTNTCPVCMGMPGALPVLNIKVVELGIRLGLALNCSIEARNVFSRKNYFYPDLPKGYQITQYENPLCSNGFLDITLDSSAKRIGVRRVHMEEDAGKSIHDESRPLSYIDFNRSGVALLEIVSEPDLSTPEEAVAYLKELRQILMYLEICDGNMDEGSFRCDANVSVRPKGSRGFGTRTELKNMNSFRNVLSALNYEIARHIHLIEQGHEVRQETMLWDVSALRTVPMRSKEESHDYRYFPDPDLVAVVVDSQWVEAVRKTMPELPAARRYRFVRQYGLPAYDADQLTQTRSLADYFEECAGLLNAPKDISNWIMTELLRVLKDVGDDISSLKVTPEMLTGLLRLLKEGVVSGLKAKEVFAEMASTGRGATDIIKEHGLEQMSNDDELKAVCARVIEKNPREAGLYRSGKTQLLGFFIGEVMKATRGKANPKVAGVMVRGLLEG